MVKASIEPLKPNPFLTYRDPVTGLWGVVKESDSLSAWPEAVKPKNELVSQTTNQKLA